MHKSPYQSVNLDSGRKSSEVLVNVEEKLFVDSAKIVRIVIVPGLDYDIKEVDYNYVEIETLQTLKHVVLHLIN